jgi:large subunit ribosomal protein L10
MPSQKNIQILGEIKEKLQKAKTVVVTDYKGLSVAQQTQLRNQLKEADAELKVYKNTLLKLAFQDQGFPAEDSDKNLTGPAAVVFAYSDEVEPVKKVYEFAKINEMPKFKFGFLGKEFINADRIRQLGELPSKEILLAKLIGSLNSPIFGLTNVLQGNIRKLLYILKKIEDQKSQITSTN